MPRRRPVANDPHASARLPFRQLDAQIKVRGIRGSVQGREWVKGRQWKLSAKPSTFLLLVAAICADSELWEAQESLFSGRKIRLLLAVFLGAC